MWVTLLWAELLLLLCLLITYFLSKSLFHWKKKQIFYFEPIPIFGNFYEIVTFKKTIGEHFTDLYNRTVEPFFGIYVLHTPSLIIRSPKLIKQILVKDFQYFSDHSIYAGDHDQLAKNILFFSKNPEWKTLRTKITPVLTTEKLKNMVPLINSVVSPMKEYVHQVATKQPSVEMKEFFARYMTDVAARCAFGINAHCFEDEDAEFRRMGRLAFDFRWSTVIKQFSAFFAPSLSSLFRFKFIDETVSNYMRNVIWNVIEERRASGIKQNDLIDHLIELLDNEKFCAEVNFEGDKVVAQAGQFLAAGYEATSSPLSYAVYELALHPEIQTKLRNEIKASLEQYGEFTYESIQQMKYLHMVLCETMRKYPVIAFLDRRCTMDYSIPDSDVVIEKGTPVYIPIYSLQHDPQYFPNPEEFDPERFSDDRMNDLVPFTYLPFGEGPRTCIGERFGWLSAKLGLVHFLSEFEVLRSEDTPKTIEFEPKSYLLVSKVGLPVKIKAVESLN